MSGLTNRLRGVFADAYDKIRKGELRTLIPFLCLFRVNGRSMGLQRHYQFAPMFNTVQPLRSVWMCARQVGKSNQLGADTHLRSGLIPHYHSLIVQPRADQIQRFNCTVFQPMLRTCPVKEAIIKGVELDKMALKSYMNGSMVYMDHVFTSPDRVRGAAGLAAVKLDESVIGTTRVFYTSRELDYKLCNKPVAAIRAGDLCLSFSENRPDSVLWSVAVRNATPHGARECYRVSTATGKSVICTSDHPFPTTSGSMRLSEIVDYEYAMKHSMSDHTGSTGHPLTRVRLEDTVRLCDSRMQEQLRSIPQGQAWETCLNVFQDLQDTLPAGALWGMHTGNLMQDPIVDVEYVGTEDVFDIEVEGTRNYILENGICSYNCQDIEYEFIPVILETMSASLYWYFSSFTGTPKTTDTTLALLWDQSSKAEWVIRCPGCNYFNVPNPEQDLIKMLGRSGPVCAKCGKSINPASGGYVHAIPSLARESAGYHLAQVVHPLHTANEAKWKTLLNKVDNYTQLTLYNEVFGWPYDAATSPLTMADLQRAVHGVKKIERPSDVIQVADKYSYITVSVDWGGGSAVSDSYTSYAVLGLRAGSDVIDVLFGKRIPKGVSPSDEASEILSWIAGVKANAFSYDNGGAGFTRLEIMHHRGLSNLAGLIIIPINYVPPGAGDVMKARTNMREPGMYYYTLDKSRSLAVCLMAIKAARVQMPAFAPEDENAYQRDFLALREDPRKTLRNETVILIIKKPGVPDDFAHAVNFGCSQIWDHFGAYPRIGTRYDSSALAYDEAGNAIVPDEVFGPRGDFERFRSSAEYSAAVFNTGDIDNDYR